MGWITTNPVDAVPRPAHRYRRRELPNLEALRTLYQYCLQHDGTAENFTAFMLMTGLRPGEATALRWDDVDFARRRLRVQRTGAYIDGRYAETPPKTRAGERVISLNADAILVLQRQRCNVAAARARAGERWDERGLVFPGERGQPIYRSVAGKWVQRVCQAAGVPNMRPHDLRHGHASLLLATGSNVAVVARRLGHNSPDITMRIYAHSLQDDSSLAESITHVLHG